MALLRRWWEKVALNYNIIEDILKAAQVKAAWEPMIVVDEDLSECSVPCLVPPTLSMPSGMGKGIHMRET